MKLSNLDILPKLDKEYRVGTPLGGLLSIFSLLSTVLLFYFQIVEWNNPPIRQRLSVHQDPITGPDGYTLLPDQQPRYDVEIDITFPEAACHLLHLDVIDSYSQSVLSLEDKVKNFTRIDKTGKIIKQFPKKFLSLNKVQGCGSCYNAYNNSNDANETNSQPKCCNTCKEVLNAYSLNGAPPPLLSEIQQCKYAVDLIKEMENEGCNIHSTFKVVKMAGRFHVSPGLSFDRNGWHVHDLRPFGENFSHINLTHTINTLKFSENDDQAPLNNITTVQSKLTKSWRVVYSIDILSNNEFSASRFENYDSKIYNPGIYFNYDISPLSAEEYILKEPFLTLITSFVSIVGGVLMLFKMIDSVCFMKMPLAPAEAALAAKNQLPNM